MNTQELERIAVAVGMAALTGIILIIAVLAYLLTHAQATPAAPPYSCRMLYEAQRACSFGKCDPRELERLRKECLRDGGRP